jgi:hypothetical protein
MLITFLTIIITSCKKSTNPVTTTPLQTNAVIINTAPIAADGCGWLVKINGTNEVYSPVNLSSMYQKDSLKVNITYHVLSTKLSCGMLAGGGVTQIQLDAITAP